MTSRLIALVGALALHAVPAAQATWFVDRGNCPGGTGSLTDPFCEIQDAIDASISGDQIWVQPGAYTCVNFNGKDVSVMSLAGPSSTILRGARFENGETTSAVLDGFGFSPCSSNTPAIRIDGASPTISGNIFRYLVIVGGGSAMYVLNGSAPRVLFNDFLDNQCVPGSAGRAGAVYVSASSPHFEGNRFQRNLVFADFGTGEGGAVWISGSNVSFTSNLFDGNVAGDEQWNHGGALYATNSTLEFRGNTFTRNRALDSDPLFGIVPGEGGALHLNSCVTLLSNNVFWSDIASIGQEIHANGGALKLDYCTVDQGQPGITGTGSILWGSGMLTIDPLLGVNGALNAGSPNIDAGTPSYGLGGQDGDGDPRVLDGNGDGVARIDIGWDERNTTQLLVTGDGTLGTSIDFTTDGLPGQIYALAASPGIGDVPFRSFGSILISLSGFQRVGGGVVPNTDSFAIPVSSSLIGLRAYFQSVAISTGTGIGSFSRRVAITLH